GPVTIQERITSTARAKAQELPLQVVTNLEKRSSHSLTTWSGLVFDCSSRSWGWLLIQHQELPAAAKRSFNRATAAVFADCNSCAAVPTHGVLKFFLITWLFQQWLPVFASCLLAIVA